MELIQLSACKLGEQIRAGKVGVREAALAYLKQIEKQEPAVHAYLDIERKKVLKRADEVQQGIREGKYTSPLAGVPVAVKDNICTSGIPTT